MKLTPIIGVAATAATGAIATIFLQSPANALCWNPGCTVIESSSATSKVGFIGTADGLPPPLFTGAPPATSAPAGTYDMNKVRLKISFSGFAGPLQIASLGLTGDGITGTLNMGSFNSATAPSNIYTSWFNLTTPLLSGLANGPNFANSAINFDLSAGALPDGVTVGFVIEYGSNAVTDSTTGAGAGYAWIPSSYNSTTGQGDPVTFTTFVKAPSPLPLLGAGAAFGCSRRIRRRIRLAA